MFLLFGQEIPANKDSGLDTFPAFVQVILAGIKAGFPYFQTASDDIFFPVLTDRFF
jgi:hypothetical protein